MCLSEELQKVTGTVTQETRSERESSKIKGVSREGKGLIEGVGVGKGE